MANTNEQIQGYYQKYLGRGYSDPNEGQGWLNDPNAEANIKGSGEAQAYAQKQAQPQQQTQWAPQTAQPQVQATQPQAAPQRNTSANGWYTEGTKTYDQNGLLQGDAGYNRAALADALYKLQTSADRGNGINLDQWLAEHQDIAKGVTSGKGGEMINLPGGGSYDVRRGYNAGSGTGDFVSFGAAGDPGDRNAAVGAGGGDYSGGGGGGSSFSSSTGGYGTTGQRDELYNMLMGRAKQGLNVDAKTDPSIRAQADPYAANVERSRRDYLANEAEQKGPLANIEGESRLSAERGGQASGLFESQLVGREIQSRRDEIAQALSSMQGMLSQEQQLAMQRELAQLDASLRNRQISSGNDQFMANLGLQSENQNNYWDAVRSGRLG